LKYGRMWDQPKIRDRINKLLDLIGSRDLECESDMAGGGCPAMVGILFVLEKIADEEFFGTVEITSKGPKLLKPSIYKQTFKVDELYKEYLI